MKRILSLAVLFCICLCASAGDVLSLGVKGGVNVSGLSRSDFDNITTGHGGLFLRLRLGPVALQPEVLYSRLGADADISVTKDDIRFDYLLVPVMVKVYPMPLLGFNLQAGPQFGYLAHHTSTAKDDFDIKDSDLSINLGAGWDTRLGLCFDARYCIGTSNVLSGDKFDVKNRCFMFSVGYAF